MLLSYCNWRHVSHLSFLRDERKIFGILCPSHLLPTLQEVKTTGFNLHYTFIIILLFLFFVNFVDFKSSSLAYLVAFGLKTLTSKNAAWPATQNPLAHILSLNSFPFAVWFLRLSPVLLKVISVMPNCISFALDSKRVAWSDRNLLFYWQGGQPTWCSLFLIHTVEVLLRLSKILSNHF